VLSWCFESKSVAVFCVPGSIIAHFSEQVTGDVFEFCGLEQDIIKKRIADKKTVKNLHMGRSLFCC